MSKGPVRTDRDPIAERFPALGDFDEVYWLGWRVGSDGSSDRVPGPSDVIIQAFVTLGEADFEAARDGYEWQPPPADWTDRIEDQLRSYAPASSNWVTNEHYAGEVRTNAYGGAVYLELDTGTVYLNLNSH